VRIFIYSSITLFCFSALLYWALYCATPVEFNLFFWPMIKSYVYLLIGFLFYITRFPEKYISNYWVQMCFHGHMWWHIFVFLNGYTLFWLLREGLLHMENSANEIPMLPDLN